MAKTKLRKSVRGGRKRTISAQIQVRRFPSGVKGDEFQACIFVGRNRREPDTESCGYGKNPRAAIKDMFKIQARYGVGSRKRGAFAGIK